MKRQREIVVECESCRSTRLCRAKGVHYRRAAMAWAHGREATSCPSYAPRWFRGIEGVYPCPSPRPTGEDRQRGDWSC